MAQLRSWMSVKLVALDVEAGTRGEVLTALADLLLRAGKVSPEGRGPLLEALGKRETLASTALENGVAVPHAYLDFVPKECIALLRTRSPVPFKDASKPGTDLYLLVSGPSRKAAEHLQILARAARLLRDEEFLARLRAARSASEVIAAFRDGELPDQAPAKRSA